MSAIAPKRLKHLRTVILSLALSCLIALLPLFPGVAVSVANVPNPRVNSTWVTDMAEMIEPEAETKLNQIISELEATDGTEIAVVTVPDTAGSASPKAFAAELFNTWGIGKEGEDDGVLFLVSKGDRRTEVETGYGVEGMLPDAKVGRILDTLVTPQFKAGNFSLGIVNGTEAIVLLIKGEDFSSISTNIVPSNASSGSVAAPPTPNQVASNNSVQSSSPAYSRSAQPTSGFVKLLWLLVLAAIAPGVVLAKRLRKGEILYEAPILQIEPIGQSKHYKMNDPWMYQWATIWASEKLAKHAKTLSWWTGRYKGNEILAGRYGWLATYRQNQQFNRKGLGLFTGLLAVSVFSLMLPVSLLLEVLAACGWLTYEIWMATDDKDSVQRFATVVGKVLLVILVLCILLLVAGGLTAGIAWMLFPFLFVATLGTSAGLVRLLRVSPVVPNVLCGTCDRSMERLSPQDLSLHLKKSQQVEMSIGSIACEGWHCSHCVPASGNNLSDISEIRLFFFDRKKRNVKTCRACNAKTLEVTTKILRQATTSHSGSKLITRECHSCGERSEKRVTIPRRSSSSSSSSSSYSGSSSSSSSSGGSSGGSFGGGSSGGGGAGSSW